MVKDNNVASVAATIAANSSALPVPIKNLRSGLRRLPVMTPTERAADSTNN